MIDLFSFIKRCEKDLISQQDLSKDTLNIVQHLAEKDRILCKPIIDFITGDSSSSRVKSKVVEFRPEDRILVCRLLPLYFLLNTGNPTWSSFLLSNSVKSVISINGFKISEIGIAFLEILCEFSVPLSNTVYSFCVDLSREFVVRFRDRLNELDPIISWENPNCISVSSVSFLRDLLVPNGSNQPFFLLKTMQGLINSDYWETFYKRKKYLFEDLEYLQNFMVCLSNSQLPQSTKDLILTTIKN